MRLSAKQAIVVGMGADPKPHETVCRFDRQRAVVSTDPSGPEAADLLEVKRWMPRVLLQTGVRQIGEVLDIRR
jgi:hypothetical protein